MNYEKGSIRKGYTNRLLSVDLTTGSIKISQIQEKVRDYFLGGRSLALYLLSQATDSETKATDPENPLILANGPLGGIPSFPGERSRRVGQGPLVARP